MFKNSVQPVTETSTGVHSYNKPLIVDSPELAGVLPSTFLHGYASASYQIEGGYQTDGRGPSIWDQKLMGMENGDEAVDSYGLWREDVELLKKYGATGYRFSISWSRVIPLGGKDDPVNQKGLDYYSNLIDALLEANITPFVTLFHWDTPLELEKRYNSWLASGKDKERLMQDFDRYADLLFRSFGDRVKNWITHNEPMIYTMLTAAFLRVDHFEMDVDRWVIGNHLLLTHARAVDIYRKKFQSLQKGQIGITLNIEWMEPFDDSAEAAEAADRSLGLSAGWFADPIYFGHHNKWVKQIAGVALGDFTAEEWDLIKGSSDFFGLNHYSTRLTTGVVLSQPEPIEAFFGGCETTTILANGQPIGHKGYNGHPYDVPWGFKKLLLYVQATWTGSHIGGEEIPIYVTENGFAGAKEAGAGVEIALEDVERQNYFEGYLRSLLEAVQEGVVVKGYFGWSLLDNLEWNMGYKPRFGVTFVDREDGFKRIPKDSTRTVKRIFEYAKSQMSG